MKLISNNEHTFKIQYCPRIKILKINKKLENYSSFGSL